MTSTTAEPAMTFDAEIARKGYVRPEVLVTTEWLAAHLDDPKLRILESDEDVLLFDTGHIPSAQKVDWHADLNDPVVRDYISSEKFEELLRSKGIDESTPVVFYGDKNNWWATYAFWVFQLFGFTNARVLDGGRTKWEKEGRPTGHGGEDLPPDELPGAQARRRAHPRVQGRGAGAHARTASDDRRAIAGGVQRPADAHGRVSAGRRAARRTHSRREKRPVGPRRESRWLLQERRRAAQHLRARCGSQEIGRCRRVLPYR